MYVKKVYVKKVRYAGTRRAARAHCFAGLFTGFFNSRILRALFIWWERSAVSSPAILQKDSRFALVAGRKICRCDGVKMKTRLTSSFSLPGIFLTESKDRQLDEMSAGSVAHASHVLV